ncbi:hypothetical protein [uncultured Robinsoniella sp.]|uniref:hypothetical protein n=1 Tax=uncultured Robinsoniella sp. TaxID=904190 RepID=UPI00374E5C26
MLLGEVDKQNKEEYTSIVMFPKCIVNQSVGGDTVNYSGYDWINSCDNISGSGFYLYPTNLSKKWNEDADGPAHYSYNNVSMNSDGSGVLYDIGVAVGNDKAKGVTQVSTGADMWLWAFLYGLFF